MDVIGLHPTALRTEGNCRVLQSDFGVGKLLVGTVPGQEGMELNANATRLSQGSWELPQGAKVHHSAARIADFYELEDLEPEPRASCRSCKRLTKECPQCSYRGGKFTLEELESVEQMQGEMFHDEEAQVIKVSYPFKPEADHQPNNFRQIRTIQENIERRVEKDGLREAYNEEIRKMVEVGSVRKLSKSEMEEW